ncbi:MAG: hypothetical protein ACOVMO_09710, partial [Caulobacter sp.]
MVDQFVLGRFWISCTAARLASVRCSHSAAVMQTRWVSRELGAVSFLQTNRVLSGGVLVAVGLGAVGAAGAGGEGSAAIIARPDIRAASIGADPSLG